MVWAELKFQIVLIPAVESFQWNLACIILEKNSVTVSAHYEDWEDTEGLGPQRWCHLKGI